jgi:nucleotide-binding universal stress UspA family protein
MADQRSERPVLVGVDNLDHVQQLVRTAGDLARLGSGTVRLVTVAVKRSDSPFSVLTDETIVREFAEASHELLARATTPEGVVVDRDILVARSPAQGLLAAVDETDPAALVVGWQEGTSRADAVLGTTIDTLIERAPCDLYIERVGQEADGVDSILLPVAGGPHVEPAARIAGAIAARNDARVLVYAVETNDIDATANASAGRDAVLDVADVPTETEVEPADDVTAAVVEAAAAHDVVVLGTTRQSSLRRKLAGSVPRRVVDRTDATVILGRNGEVVGESRSRLDDILGR